MWRLGKEMKERRRDGQGTEKETEKKRILVWGESSVESVAVAVVDVVLRGGPPLPKWG